MFSLDLSKDLWSGKMRAPVLDTAMESCLDLKTVEDLGGRTGRAKGSLLECAMAPEWDVALVNL